MTTRNTVNVIEGTVTVVEVITAGPQGALGGGGGAGTDLSYDATTRTIASSTGTDAVLPVATTALAGLESAADKLKLDSITVDSATLVRKYVRNVSGVTIPKGAAVYQTGSSGTTITVALADASLEATAAQTLGLAQDAIPNNSNGIVIAVGELTGLDTSALTEGAIIWLSETTGALTTTRPTQPAHGVVLGYCVKQGPGTSGIVYIKVDNGLELEELHDVLIVSPAAGQVLRRASDGLWKNAQLAYSDLSGAPTPVTSVTATGLLTSSGGTTPQISTSIATNSLAGRFTAGTGALEAITIGSGLAISGGALVVTAGGTGTVTSVGLSLPSIFSVTGSPVTTSGTLAATLATQAANLVFAGPSSGAAAAPTFRQLGYSELSGLPTLGGAAALNVGTTTGTVAAGDDGRLSDQRTPTDGSVTDAKITATGLSAGSVNWTNITAWAPSTAYNKGDLVEYLGIAYRRATAGTSGTTFNTANWNQTTPSAVMSHGHATFTSSTAGYVPASGGGTTNFLRADGTFAAPPGGGGAANYQEFTSSGTWTKPSGCTHYYAEVVGGGGGGGGGRSGVNTGNRAGGGGGAGGVLTFRWGRVSDLGATETITIGAGGTGGAGNTNTTGANGAAGGTSSFGSVLSAIGGGGGNGGSTTAGAAGAIQFRGNAAFGAGFAGAGGAGGTGSAAGSPGAIGAYGPGGGAGGGSISANDATVFAPGTGGAGFGQNVANATMANATTGGGSTLPGDGGGGGAASTTGAGTSGSVGVVPGGGGGGGGACTNGSLAGSGGNGAAGIVRIWCW